MSTRSSFKTNTIDTLIICFAIYCTGVPDGPESRTDRGPGWTGVPDRPGSRTGRGPGRTGVPDGPGPQMDRGPGRTGVLDGPDRGSLTDWTVPQTLFFQEYVSPWASWLGRGWPLRGVSEESPQDRRAQRAHPYKNIKSSIEKFHGKSRELNITAVWAVDREFVYI